MIHTMSVLEPGETPMVETCLPQIGQPSVLGLAEMLLKARVQVDDLLRDAEPASRSHSTVSVIALASFSAYSWAMVLLLVAAPAAAIPSVLADGWSACSAAGGGFVAGVHGRPGRRHRVCLPSFYFYGLLAGVKISFLQVVAHCLKGQAATAIMLIGILPIYVAIALGMLIFRRSG